MKEKSDYSCFSDWEATNEAIEEQVARESYLQWLRDNERRNPSERSANTNTAAGHKKNSSTVTSSDLKGALRNSAAAAAAAAAASASPKAATSSAGKLILQATSQSAGGRNPSVRKQKLG